MWNSVWVKKTATAFVALAAAVTVLCHQTLAWLAQDLKCLKWAVLTHLL